MRQTKSNNDKIQNTMNAQIVSIPSQAFIAAATVAAYGGSAHDIAQARDPFAVQASPAAPSAALPIVLTKSMLRNIAWPKGATHLRIEAPKGRWAVVSKKDATTALDGVNVIGFQFGVILPDKKGNKSSFNPFAVQPERLFEVGEVIEAKKPDAKPDNKAAKSIVKAGIARAKADRAEKAKADKAAAKAATVSPAPDQPAADRPTAVTSPSSKEPSVSASSAMRLSAIK